MEERREKGGTLVNLRREMKGKKREKEVFNITTVEVVKDS